MDSLKLLCVALIFLTIVPELNASAQTDSLGAECALNPIGDIPAVKPNTVTNISLQYVDTIGVNWTRMWNVSQHRGFIPIGFHRKFGIGGRLLVKIIWPIVHPTWRPWMGYSSMIFTTQIIGDSSSSWTAVITPSSISNTTDGTSKLLTLRVSVNNIGANSSPIIRVIATRYYVDGTPSDPSYADIPVRSEPLNFLSVNAETSIKTTGPGQEVPFAFSITNLGYFTDTFAFNVSSSNPKIKAAFSEQSVVLQPSENRQITLWVMTPETFFDSGTANIINFTAYSVRHPNEPFKGSVSVYVKGYYASGLALTSIGGAIFLILLLFIFFFVVLERRAQEVYGKPTKPWKIPEEQMYLAEIKRDRPDVYKQDRAMMVDEYKSALDFYKDSRRTARFQPKEKTSRTPLLSPLTKRLTLAKKPKTKKAPISKEEPKPAPSTPPLETELTKALQRIEKEQARQQRRFKK